MVLGRAKVRGPIKPANRSTWSRRFCSVVFGSMMANAFHAEARAKGFGEVIHALMHDSNLSAQHSGNTGGKVFRRYALWGGRL